MEEKPFTLFDVWTSKEAFICGTGAEVVPVLSVDDRTIGAGVIGPVTGRIVAAYHELVRAQGTPIQPRVAGARSCRGLSSLNRHKDTEETKGTEARSG